MWFLKEHLNGRYHWANENNTSAYTGNPSRRLFDRYNGDQVLFLINLYGSLSGKLTVADGQRMEELLTGHLPLEARSEISVFNWLREVFDRMTEDNTISIT
jgi:hypothetical protein